MANDLSLDTLKNNKMKTQVIMYLMISLIMIALGATFAGTGTTAALIGGVLAIFGGGYMGYLGYDMLVDPKNERKCKAGYFEQIFTNVTVPQAWIDGDVAIDIELDIDEATAVTNAQFNGYGGVFLVSNIAAESVGGTYDAYYVPGNARAVLTKPSTKVSGKVTDSTNRTVADKLYIRAGPKTNVRVVAKTDDNSKTEIKSSPFPLPFTTGTDACASTVTA